MNGNRSERPIPPRRNSPGKPTIPNPPHAQEQLLANPRWLLGALLGVLCLAAACVYGTACLLFWLGQWQIVFHPSHEVSVTAPLELHYEDLRFDATETGLLQLNGWWIPADPAGRYADDTILFLHDGVGSLSNSVDQLQALHALGINVFAFDYRGFGASANIHPSEKRTVEDANAAWRYLTDTRHLRPETIVIYGVGLGAAIAAESARQHPHASALVLENPQPPVLERVGQNPHARWLPLRLIFQDRFDPSGTLGRLTMPKLFIGTSQSPGSTLSRPSATPPYYGGAAQPKVSVLLGAPPYRDESYLASLGRFLGKYLPAASP